MALLFSLILAICTGPGLLESSRRVRLVGGRHRCEGRVEVEQEGRWGAVCDDGWDLKDVAVVCQELSCGQAKGTPSGNLFKNSTEKELKIIIQDVKCNGREDTLSQCEHEDVFDCSYDEAAGARCEKPSPRVRLVGGRHPCEGRVQVEQEGRWVAVCDDGWDLKDVAVVCRELGCGKAKGTRSGILYKKSTGKEQKLLIQDVKCNGMEDTLSQCEHEDVFDCSYDEVAEAWCEKPSPRVRLVGGRHRCEGQVEVEQKGHWGAVCHHGWDMKDVAVVCQELGCGQAKGTPSDILHKSSTGKEQEILIQDVNCNGMEDTLFHCGHEDIFNCSYYKAAGALCEKSSPRVRLVGGRHRCEGWVEVEQKGHWGAVCHHGWDMKDVAVVCRELGCGEAKGTSSDILYKNSREKEREFLIQGVNCNGTEDTLFHCGHEDAFDCSYDEAAGALCEKSMRLAGGPGRCKGRVEVKHQGQWGTVCETGWSLLDAKVVCRELECGRAILTRRCCNKPTQDQEPIWLSHVSCSGQEASLQDCPSLPWGKNNCTHDEDMWVECEDPFDLRLVGGDNNCSGRLEVLHKGEWGSVCDDGWGEKENLVVCKQLGCGESLFPSVKARRSFGLGVGRIWLDDVHCSGEERSLEQCKHRFWGYHNCNHKEDVAVICSEEKPGLLDA